MTARTGEGGTFISPAGERVGFVNKIGPRCWLAVEVVGPREERTFPTEAHAMQWLRSREKGRRIADRTLRDEGLR